MSIKTTRSDVVANFVRYHGRQPKASDEATIQYLTTKAPIEVEKLLAKNSPITKGLVWSEYNKQKDSNNEKPTSATYTFKKKGEWYEKDLVTNKETKFSKSKMANRYGGN